MGNNIKSVKHNFIMNLIFTVSSTLFPLITFPYISRVLLADGSGKASFAIGVVTYFAMIASAGIPNYGIRATAVVRNDKELLSKVTQELLIINLICTAIVYIAFLVSLFIIPQFMNRKLVLLVASSLMWLNLLGVTWLYNGLEQYSYITEVSVLFKFIAMILVFVFVKDTDDYVIYTAITVVSTSGSYLLNFIRLRKFVSFKKDFKYEFKKHFKPISFFFATTVASTVATSLDIVMLGFMQNDVSVGYYNVAVKVKTVLISVVTSLGTVLIPRLSNYIAEGKEKEFKEIIAKSFNFILVVASAATVYFMIFAKDVILVLAGKDFLGAILPMQLLLPSVLLIGLSNITGVQVLVPKGLEDKVFIAIGAGAITNILLNLVLIPNFDVNGAAMATVISDVVALGIETFMLKDFLRQAFRGSFNNVAKIAIALGISSAVAIGLRNVLVLSSIIRLIITFISFSSVYFITLVVLQEKFVKTIILPYGVGAIKKIKGGIGK